VSRKWKGSKIKDHITEADNSHNLYVYGAKGSAIDRASTDGSSTATEKDPRKSNEKANTDDLKAPEPVIGMNDERGVFMIPKSISSY
jgi:hypothetical protein